MTMQIGGTVDCKDNIGEQINSYAIAKSIINIHTNTKTNYYNRYFKVHEIVGELKHI